MIVLALLGVAVLGIVLPILSARRRRRAGLAAVDGVTLDGSLAQGAHAADAPRGPARLGGAFVLHVLLLAVAAGALWMSRDFGPRAGLFPWATGIPTVLLLVALVARDLMGQGRPVAMEAPADVAPEEATRRSLIMAGWIVGFLVAIWLLGFSLATLVVSLLYLRLTARERWPLSVAVSLLGFLFVYAGFERGLGVPFPPGRLALWLGLAG